MNKIKKMILLGVVFGVLLAGATRGTYAFAEEAGVTSEETVLAEQESSEAEQETIDENEIPLAGEPATNTVAFMWCGFAMVVVLATITGYASFGKEKVVRR